MSGATRNEVQSLYRSYLRLIADWPADLVRPNRDMKKVLTARVQEMFRQSDHAQVDVAEARRQLEALERLLANDFKEKVNTHHHNSLSLSLPY
jgi:Complex 1 protein (LYR family)